jgi:trehalose/maltose transport system permease protein
VATEAATAPQAPRGLGALWRGFRSEFRSPERRTAYWMILPTLLIIVAIAFFPIFYAIFLSFREATPTSAGAWVGIDNYSEIFSDADFHTALWNTSLFTVVSVALELTLGMLIALALNRIFIARGPVRAIALVPYAFPTVISASMWRLMYQDQVGIMSYLAEKIGLISAPILSSDTSLMVGAIVVDVWKTTPFMAILLLAGLQVISQDVYEAARVDGATPWQQFWRITLPLVKPAMVVALLFRTLDAWRIYDLFWVMSNRELESLSTYVFKGVRISQLEFATGNTASVFIFFSSLLIAILFIRGMGLRTSQ